MFWSLLAHAGDITKVGLGGQAFSREGMGEGGRGQLAALEWSLGEIIITRKYMIRMVGISWLAERRRLANAMPKET